MHSNNKTYKKDSSYNLQDNTTKHKCQSCIVVHCNRPGMLQLYYKATLVVFYKRMLQEL